MAAGPVLVTGANSGVGLATTLKLAARGFECWGTVRSTTAEDSLRQAGQDAGLEHLIRPLRLDVSDAAAVVETWPSLPDFAAVVNNAGYTSVGAIEDMDPDAVARQLAINLVAPGVIARCALPGMRRRGGGRIVMVSSIGGRVAFFPLNGWYHASKHGLEALARILRIETAGFGVGVSIVSPGAMSTGLQERANTFAESQREGAGGVYGPAYARLLRISGATARFSPGPDSCAEAIVHAVTAPKPRRRYLVGADARAVVALDRLVPGPVLDRLIRSAMAL